MLLHIAAGILTCLVLGSNTAVINNLRPCIGANCTRTEFDRNNLPCSGGGCMNLTSTTTATTITTATELLPTEPQPTEPLPIMDCDHVQCPELSSPGCEIELTFPEGPECACAVCQTECPELGLTCIQAGPECENTLVTYPNTEACPPCVTCVDPIPTEPTPVVCPELKCPSTANCRRVIPAPTNRNGCAYSCPWCIGRQRGRSARAMFN